MTDTDPAPTGNFEVHRSGEACWCDLVRGNGVLLARSRTVRVSADVSALVQAMRHPDARLRGRMSAQGEFYFTIELGDDVLATSPMFVFPADRDGALELTRATIPNAAMIVLDEETPR